MANVIFRNPTCLSVEDVFTKFKKDVSKSTSFKEEMEELANIYATFPADKYIIAEKITDTDTCQGDIIIMAEGTDLYNENIKNVENLQESTNFVVQEDDSVTGDHRIVPLEGSNYTLKRGTFFPEFLKGSDIDSMDYPIVSFETDKPFILVHREHGNIVLREGKYLFCSQLNPYTLDRMRD